jgi:sortase (surface protein transpeptidase)
VIAAHRDTLFAGLRDVRIGDLVTMRTGDREFSYRVSAIDVVTPRSLHVLEPTAHASLTLITCFPFDFVGPAPMRYVVSATEMSALAEQRKQPASGGARTMEASAGARGTARALDPRVLSFLSGSLVKPGAS